MISEAVHSLLDLFSAFVAFFTIRHAGKPADEGHPFGHGKFETLSSLLESFLLLAAAGFVLNEGIDRFKHPREVEQGWLAILTLMISVGVSYWVYRHNRNAAQKTESSAIYVNALHFLADVVASLGVLVGLVLLQVTGWNGWDAISALGIAAYILGISWKQIKNSMAELLDTGLPDDEIKKLRDVIDGFSKKILNVHDIRTRKSGAYRHIMFHLVVCGRMSVSESHQICDQMEEAILGIYPQSSVTIHVEPCEQDKPGCEKTCPWGG